MFGKMFYTSFVTSIVCAISRGSVAGVPFGNNYAPDISNFELHQRLRLLEDLQVKAADESMVMRKTMDTYQNMLGKVFTDLTTLNYEFGKLQNENQLLHSRLDYVMMKNNDLLTLCGKKCMDPENLDHFRDTENKLESDHTTDRNDSYPFVSTPVESHVDPNTYKLTKPLHSNPKHVIRQSPVPILGAKRVSEDIGGRGFFAKTSQTLSSVSVGYTIIFDDIITNTHNDYNSHTGVFTCDLPGLYVFTWTIQINIHFLKSQLMKNGVAVADGFTGDDVSYWTSETSTAVLSLVHGDDVVVHVYDNAGSVNVLPHVTSFSGFLV